MVNYLPASPMGFGDNRQGGFRSPREPAGACGAYWYPRERGTSGENGDCSISMSRSGSPRAETPTSVIGLTRSNSSSCAARTAPSPGGAGPDPVADLAAAGATYAMTAERSPGLY